MELADKLSVCYNKIATAKRVIRREASDACFFALQQAGINLDESQTEKLYIALEEIIK